jgi:hypothetical protein
MYSILFNGSLQVSLSNDAHKNCPANGIIQSVNNIAIFSNNPSLGQSPQLITSPLWQAENLF